MKKGYIKLLDLMIVAGILIGYNVCLEAKQKTWKLESETEIVYVESTQTNAQENQTGYQDGEYEGSAQGFGGPIEVRVRVEAGKISTIEIVSAEKEDASFLSMAEDVIDEMLEQQSTEVDVVSGATFSSNGIIDATKAALEGTQK